MWAGVDDVQTQLAGWNQCSARSVYLVWAHNVAYANCSARPVLLWVGGVWVGCLPALFLGKWVLGQVSPQLLGWLGLGINALLGCSSVQLGLCYWLCLVFWYHLGTVQLGLASQWACSGGWLGRFLWWGVVQLGLCTEGVYLIVLMLLVGHK